MRTCTCLGILLAVLSVPVAAAAQRDQSHDQEARALFEAGRTAFEAGRFDAALKHFQSAYDLSGRPELLYNIGSAADRLRMDDKALDAFQQYLQKVPNAPNRGEVESRVNVLKKAVAARKAAAAAEAEEAASHGSSGATAATTSGSTETPPPTEHAAEATKKPVPTPKQAAQAAQPEAQATPAQPSPQPKPEHKGGVVHKWWFWTIIGVVAVGGALGVTAAVASQGGGGSNSYIEGPQRPIVFALRAR